MNEKLLSYLVKPEVYTKSTAKFWDDEHISKGMLKAHLDPEFEGASRKHKFMDQSVDWIAGIVPSAEFPKLLDLGCGPGLYAQRFYRKGYQVTGVDYSRRSLEYATKTAEQNNQDIIYHYQDYLNLSCQEEFDIITLIYCDFCVLSDRDRKELLSKIYQALKPNGRFIVDVTTPNFYKYKEEMKTWSFQEESFWSDQKHLLLNAFYRYDESNTFMNQAVIITEDCVQCYYLWDHTFTKEELTEDLCESGFQNISYYGDVAGAQYREEGDCMCTVAVKVRS